MSGANKRVSRRFTEFWSTGDEALADEALDPEIVFHGPSSVGDVVGLDGVKAMVARFRAAFPDERSTVVDQVAEGDKVVTRWRANGTHEGDYGGLEPTGRKVAIDGITIERIAAGKIVEVSAAWDELGLMRQLGAVPAPLGN
jgi:steroid delta-isomerase-like uncharacterized protein